MFNPSLMSANLTPHVTMPPAAPCPAPATASAQPGAFGRELQRAADAAQTDAAENAAPDPEAAETPAELPAAPARTPRRPLAAAGPRPTQSETADKSSGVQTDGNPASLAADDAAHLDPLSAEGTEKALADGTAIESPADLSAWLAQAQWAGRAEPAPTPGLALPAAKPALADAQTVAVAGAGAGAGLGASAVAVAVASTATVLANTAPAGTGGAASALKAELPQTGAPLTEFSSVRSHAATATRAATTPATGVAAAPEALGLAANAWAAGSGAATLAAPWGETQPGAARPDMVAAEAALGAGAAPGAAAQAPAADSLGLPTVASDSLEAPLGSREFAQALGARVAHFARNGVEHARLNINPAEMGPIALQLALDGMHLRVDLVAEVAATRQMLEQALPTLASTLRDAGLTLSGGGVFQQARDNNGAGGNAQGRADNGARADPSALAEPESAAQAARSVRLDGLVDTYA